MTSQVCSDNLRVRLIEVGLTVNSRYNEIPAYNTVIYISNPQTDKVVDLFSL